MPTFEVQKVEEPKAYQTTYGTMYSVPMIGLLDGELQTVTMSVKAPINAPKASERLEVTVEETAYGKRIKRIPTGTLRGGSPQEHPERQASIERQNSLTNAITYCTTKANVLLANGKAEDALKELKGEHVIQVATYFARYNAGTLKVTDDL